MNHLLLPKLSKFRGVDLNLMYFLPYSSSALNTSIVCNGSFNCNVIYHRTHDFLFCVLFTEQKGLNLRDPMPTFSHTILLILLWRIYHAWPTVGDVPLQIPCFRWLPEPAVVDCIIHFPVLLNKTCFNLLPKAESIFKQ